MLPAEASGRMRPGDELVEINGHSVEGLNAEEATALIRQVRGFVQHALFTLKQRRYFLPLGVFRLIQVRDPSLRLFILTFRVTGDRSMVLKVRCGYRLRRESLCQPAYATSVDGCSGVARLLSRSAVICFRR